MTWISVIYVILFCVFAIGLSYAINRDTYKGNGQLKKYDWEN